MCFSRLYNAAIYLGSNALRPEEGTDICRSEARQPLMQVHLRTISYLKPMIKQCAAPLRGRGTVVRGRDGGQLLWIRKLVIQPIDNCC
jgi:hypothetical protein